MNRRKWMVVGIAVLALLAGAAWISDRNEASARTPYRLGAVERGDLEETVSATGTLNAVQTVTIGTQVSGAVIELHADFNDAVEEGELLARIDPTLQQQQVRNAEANLERARADLRRMQQEYDRNKTLFDQQVITESEFSEIEYSYAVARTSVESAEINLEQARQNLAYTEIYAPIDGVVIERNAEVGMTVASSLSTPQLYLLANDLSELEILASVDESDIGQISAGQQVRFTVQAYRNEMFEGTVRQVRLQSTTNENVVSYTAVVTVQNPDLRLLPGMTAVVDFIAKQAKNVLMVPNAALRFTPTEEMLEEIGDSMLPGGRMIVSPGEGDVTPEMQARIAERGGAGMGAGGLGQGGPPSPEMRERMANRRTSGGQPPGGTGGGFAALWYLQDGQLGVAPVRIGISDGVSTEISGPGLEEGMQVIAGLNTVTSEPEGTTNPFQQQRGFGGPAIFRGPGGGG
ncbi:MAG: efflux RND transporter periplasmic adaptor subunit [Gemmatimonas sp.]|nr:efflux RND transporter periplasmic adaptor subunit [Gemmatimonas sp.]